MSKGARTVRNVPFNDVGHYALRLPEWAQHEDIIDVDLSTAAGRTHLYAMIPEELFNQQDAIEDKVPGFHGIPTACCVYEGSLHFNIRPGYIGSLRIVSQDRT